MKNFILVTLLILLPNITMGQKEPFKNLKIYYSYFHEGSEEFHYQIKHEENKLYLIESDKHFEIEYFKIGYITDFIAEVKKQIIDSCNGISFSGSYRLELEIDNQKFILKNCPLEKIAVNNLLTKLKKSKTKLKEDTDAYLHWKISDLINDSFNDKLEGCWNINKNFKMKPNEILVLSKDKINDANQWCFKEGNLKTTIQNNLLYQSKLTKEDSLNHSPNGIWFVDFNIPKNSTVPKVHLSHNSYLGWYDKDLDDFYNYKPLKFIFSILDFKENLVILELIEQKKNADNEYNTDIEEK